MDTRTQPTKRVPGLHHRIPGTGLHEAPATKTVQQEKKPKDLTHYFVIGKHDKTLYIYKKTPIRWLFCLKPEQAKQFETAQKADKWLTKHKINLKEPNTWDIFEIHNTNNKNN